MEGKADCRRSRIPIGVSSAENIVEKIEILEIKRPLNVIQVYLLSGPDILGDDYDKFNMCSCTVALFTD